MARQRVSVREIAAYKMAQMNGKHLAELPTDFVQYRPKLYRQLVVPSYVHGYSLAIEYMRDWFLKHFGENYFKVVHVNGKHVLDDWKHFNNYNIKREKPMVAIIPEVDFDYDRENLDAYLADAKILLRKSTFQQSFIKDYNSMTFVYMQMRALRMNFTFRVRVESRAQQLDLFQKMELGFRIGATQYEYINADFHIPYDIMMDLAKANNFEVKNDAVVDILEFISYLNQHSDLPIVFKMRAINQRPEFFCRVKGLYTHISTMDKLSIDDGERVGKLDNNFHVEMHAVLTIPIPHFFVYFNQEPIRKKIEVYNPRKDTIGIYTINAFEIPPENEIGWGRIIYTGYEAEDGETEIDLSTFLGGEGNVAQVIKHSVDNFISPDSFIDVKVMIGCNGPQIVPGYMDWKRLTYIMEEPINHNHRIEIAIYADKKYVNDTIFTMKNYSESRIKADDHWD